MWSCKYTKCYELVVKDEDRKYRTKGKEIIHSKNSIGVYNISKNKGKGRSFNKILLSLKRLQ